MIKPRWSTDAIDTPCAWWCFTLHACTSAHLCVCTSACSASVSVPPHVRTLAYACALPHYIRAPVYMSAGTAQTTAPQNSTNRSTARSGGTKRATSVNVPLLRLRSSEGKFTMSREMKPVRRSFCRHGSCTITGSGTSGAFWPELGSGCSRSTRAAGRTHGARRGRAGPRRGRRLGAGDAPGGSKIRKQQKKGNGNGGWLKVRAK